MDRFGPPNRLERAGLALLVVLAVLFGALVVYRCAFLSRRMGDVGVYLRAGWAVRTGAAKLSEITSDHGLHYIYPPLFAVLMTPLADPPQGASTEGFLPYPVSVGIWYVVNWLLLCLAVHWLATALERGSADPAIRNVRWSSRCRWYLRILPILACMGPLGHTFSQGQVNILILFLVCGMIAGTIQGRRFLAGLCLAGAICIKIFPGLLLVYPLWRRDGRCLLGCAVGTLLGLIVIPVLAMGVDRTWVSYEDLYQRLLSPAMGVGSDRSLERELISTTSTDHQSIQSVLHNSLYPDRTTRPLMPGPFVRTMHWVVCGVLLLITFLMGRWRQQKSAESITLGLGSLALVMLLFSPVSHRHYFGLALPVLMGLLAIYSERKGGLFQGTGLMLLFSINIAAFTLAELVPLAREHGALPFAALLSWGVGCVVLRRSQHEPQRQSPALPSPLAA
jgi:hypothetical protein